MFAQYLLTASAYIVLNRCPALFTCISSFNSYKNHVTFLASFSKVQKLRNFLMVTQKAGGQADVARECRLRIPVLFSTEARVAGAQ